MILHSVHMHMLSCLWHVYVKSEIVLAFFEKYIERSLKMLEFLGVLLFDAGGCNQACVQDSRS